MRTIWRRRAARAMSHRRPAVAPVLALARPHVPLTVPARLGATGATLERTSVDAYYRVQYNNSVRGALREELREVIALLRAERAKAI